MGYICQKIMGILGKIMGYNMGYNWQYFEITPYSKFWDIFRKNYWIYLQKLWDVLGKIMGYNGKKLWYILWYIFAKAM